MKNNQNLVKGIFIGMGVMALTAFVAEKTFTIKFSETDINKHYQKLSIIKQIVDNSNLAHQDVMFVSKSIDSLQADILTQVKTQIEPAPAPKK
jgi:16S rRNA A1518/A1519 N6-dimethyltransferase RsmA/KsgA/DIM1 with predicted DNA glycosylase/AP lyase activity